MYSWQLITHADTMNVKAWIFFRSYLQLLMGSGPIYNYSFQ